jgi:hypothetical protein
MMELSERFAPKKIMKKKEYSEYKINKEEGREKHKFLMVVRAGQRKQGKIREHHEGRLLLAIFRALKSVYPMVHVHPIEKGDIINEEDKLPFEKEEIAKYAKGLVTTRNLEMVVRFHFEATCLMYMFKCNTPFMDWLKEMM